MGRRRWWALGAALLMGSALTVALVTNPPDLGRKPASELTPAATATATPFLEQSNVAMLEQAVEASGKARTARLRFTIQEEDTVVRIDVRRGPGGDCIGTFRTEGRHAEMIATEDHLFLRGDTAYWQYEWPDAVADTMTANTGRWARFPASTKFLRLCDVTELLDQLDLADDQVADFRRSPRYPYRGFVVIALEAPDSSAKVVLDTEAPHYLHQVTDREGELHLDEFNEPVEIEVPTGREFIPFTDGAITV